MGAIIREVVIAVLGVGIGYTFQPLIKSSLDKLFRKND